MYCYQAYLPYLVTLPSYPTYLRILWLLRTHLTNRFTVTPTEYDKQLLTTRKLIDRFLSLSGHYIPQIRKCRKTTSTSEQGVDKRTTSYYTQIILNVFMYVVNNNNNLEQQIKKALCKLWRTDITKYISIQQDPWNAWNSAAIQRWTGLSRESIETINNLHNDQFGFKLFSSRGKIDKVNKRLEPLYSWFIDVIFRPSVSQQRRQIVPKPYTNTVFSISLHTAIAMNADGHINNNTFKPPRHMCGPNDDRLPVMLGGDKCTMSDNLGIYIYSVAVNSPGSSSNPFNCLLMIWGDG